MAPEHVINIDLARVFKTETRRDLRRILTWGDDVEVTDVTAKHVRIKWTVFEVQPDGSIKPEDEEGFIVPTRSSGIDPQEVVHPKGESQVLKVSFVDVQQGDGTVVETPQGKVMLIDRGMNQLFARFLAGQYRRTTLGQPREIECILVSHGDADHFAGLTRIHSSETEDFDQDEQWKRFFMRPNRVFHNGLVKRPSGMPEQEALGATTTINGKLVITGLEDDLLAVDDAEMNQPFRAWKAALADYSGRHGGQPVRCRRLARGDDDAFDFLADEAIHVEVLGPILTEADGVRGLHFLREPPRGPRIGQGATPRSSSTSLSASHTINGHSVIVRMIYGNCRFLFAGDLNEEAAQILTSMHRQQLEAEVFKVPHHGSADFSIDFLRAVSPVISVVSSGDESARTEYIHPRATLMGALGKYSRLEEPLVFVTELVAFFNMEGFITPECHRMVNNVAVIENGQAVLDPRARTRFFAFSRTAFGLVKVRTDGRRLLVCTDSGQVKLKEAYAFDLPSAGEAKPVSVRQA